MSLKGWVTLGAGVAALGLGWFTGLVELYVLGGVAVVTVVVAVFSVWISAPRIDLQRQVSPARVPAGGSARVELTARNLRRRPSPVFSVEDVVGTSSVARSAFPPLGGGEESHMSYRVPVERRGLLTIGPAVVERSDPFGLAQRTRSIGAASEIVVLPTIHPLGPISRSAADEREYGARHGASLTAAHEEFATLRQFQDGDDVRRVHWPSTARLGEPIVRHFDEPWQRVLVVVLDVEESHYDTERFETAVSLAASILTSCHERGEECRLVTSGNLDSGKIENAVALDSTIDQLAVLQPNHQTDLLAAVASIGQPVSDATVVICVGVLDAPTAASLGELSAANHHITVVEADPSVAVSELWQQVADGSTKVGVS